jgi:hypothetical protein
LCKGYDALAMVVIGAGIIAPADGGLTGRDKKISLGVVNSLLAGAVRKIG